MDLCYGTGQYVLVNKEEICIFACADAASLILNEHLLGNVDGQGCESLLTGQEFFRPPRFRMLGLIYSCQRNLHNAEWVVWTAAQCREIRM